MNKLPLLLLLVALPSVLLLTITEMTVDGDGGDEQRPLEEGKSVLLLH